SWVVQRDYDAQGGSAGGTVDATTFVREVQCHVGSHARFERAVTRINTDAGRTAAREWQLEFDSALEHVALHSLAVNRHGEKREYAAPANLRIQPNAPDGHG